MTDDRLDASARLLDAAATELERALGHVRVAAKHLRDREVPRGAAHAWAARGHLLSAQTMLDDQARDHARHSRLPDDRS